MTEQDVQRAITTAAELLATPEWIREMEREHWEKKHAQHDASDRELLAKLLRGES